MYLPQDRAMAVRWGHRPEVAGSSPAPAIFYHKEIYINTSVLSVLMIVFYFMILIIVLLQLGGNNADNDD